MKTFDELLNALIDSFMSNQILWTVVIVWHIMLGSRINNLKDKIKDLKNKK